MTESEALPMPSWAADAETMERLVDFGTDAERLTAMLLSSALVHRGDFADADGGLQPLKDWTPVMWSAVRKLRRSRSGEVVDVELHDRSRVVSFLLRRTNARRSGDGELGSLADFLKKIREADEPTPGPVKPTREMKRRENREKHAAAQAERDRAAALRREAAKRARREAAKAV